MKLLKLTSFFLASLFGASALVASSQTPALKVGVVNFKLCVEKSKEGQQQYAALENLKKQMMTILEKTDKEIEDLAKKLNNQDFMDGLSPTAEEELKQKFQSLSQEFSEYQNQYYQMLNQTNFKLLQGLNEYVSKASESIAKSLGLHIILNEESAFYFQPDFDISQQVITIMDKRYEEEHKDDSKKIETSKKTQ